MYTPPVPARVTTEVFLPYNAIHAVTNPVQRVNALNSDLSPGQVRILWRAKRAKLINEGTFFDSVQTGLKRDYNVQTCCEYTFSTSSTLECCVCASYPKTCSRTWNYAGMTGKLLLYPFHQVESVMRQASAMAQGVAEASAATTATVTAAAVSSIEGSVTPSSMNSAPSAFAGPANSETAGQTAVAPSPEETQPVAQMTMARDVGDLRGLGSHLL